MPLATDSPVYRETLDRLIDLTRVSSPSDDPEGLWRAAESLAATFREAGLRARIDEVRGDDEVTRPVLVAETGDGRGDRHLLVGHLDTVLPAREPEPGADRLLATGAIDMKGGLAAFWGALRLLADRGSPIPGDLTLVVVPDEEIGGPLTRHAMTEWGPRAREVWVLEPGGTDGDAETLVAARRGLFHWHLDVRGRAAHAGNQFWEGRSALLAAASWCHRAGQLAAPGDGPTINAGRLVAGDAELVERLAEGSSILGTAHRVNVVPDRARADGEARFLRAEDGQKLRAHLERIAAEVRAAYHLEVELELSDGIPPLPPPGPEGRALAERAVALAAERGWSLHVEKDRGGISFPNLLPEPGSVPVLDGLGPVGGGMHTPDEWVSLESLRRRIVLLADLLATA